MSIKVDAQHGIVMRDGSSAYKLLSPAELEVFNLLMSHAPLPVEHQKIKNLTGWSKTYYPQAMSRLRGKLSDPIRKSNVVMSVMCVGYQINSDFLPSGRFVSFFDSDK